MGLFDSVAGTFFNAATSAYQTVVTPVQTAVQTITRPIVQGSVQTGQTQQVAVQPRPPIVTAVAPSQQVATQYAAQTGSSVTPQQTPSGNTVYVTSRPSPIQPQPVIISRPVEVQAPSAVDVVGMLAPGAAIAGVATVLSGDRNVLQNAAMDIIGIRQQQIQSQASSLTSRNQALQAQATALQQKSIQQKAALEQQALGFQQRKTQLQQRVSAFESLGPATSVEEYNTRLNEYNVLNQDIAGLNAESQRINTEAVASNRNLIREQIGILNTRDQLRAEGVNLNVASANLGTTGLGALEGFWGSVDAVVSEKITKPLMPAQSAVEPAIKIIGFVNPITAPSAVTDTLASFVGYKPTSVATIQAQYIGELYGGIREKPFTEATFFAVGAGFGGVGRLGGNIAEPLVAASKAPGAGIGAKSLGAIAKHGNTALGLMYGGYSGFRAATSPDPIGTLVQIGAQEVTPMLGGAMVGASAPEIGEAAYRGVRTGKARISGGEVGDIASELRNIPAIGQKAPLVETKYRTTSKILLNEEQIAEIRGIAGRDVERALAYDLTTGKQLNLQNIESTGRKVKYSYLKSEIDPTHETISFHSHPKEITFSYGDIGAFGDRITKVNAVGSGVVTPSGRIYLLEKPSSGQFTAKEFLKSWNAKYEPSLYKRIVQPKGVRLSTLAETAEEFGVPFRVIEPWETGKVYRSSNLLNYGGSKEGFYPTRGRSFEIGAELRSIPSRQPVFEPTTNIERPVGGKQPRIERLTDTTIQDEFLQLDYRPFEQAGRKIEPAIGLTREQMLPVPIEPQLSFVDFSKPVRGVPVSSQRLTPVYEVVSGKPGKYAYRGMQGKTNPLEGDPLGIVYENIVSEKVLTFNPAKGAFEPTVTGRAWYKSITEYGLPKSDIFMQPAIEPLGTGKVFGPVKPGRTPLGKSLDTMVGRPSEQLAAYNDFAGWKGGMESALGGGGRMEFRGGGMVSVQEMGTSATSREIPQFVKPYTKFDTSGVVGIGASASSLAKASAVAMGVSGLSLYGLPTQEVGVRGIGADSYPLFMRQINYEKFYNVGAYPTTRGAFGAEADNRRYLGGLPTIGALRVAPQDYRDIADFTGINLDITSRRQGPIVAPTRMLSPVDIVGEVNIPETAFRVAPLLVAGPDLLQTPESRIIQIPKIDLTTQLITDQILINTPEIPPYQGYDFKFEFPPIPPVIIPGFPMAPGGGGGGGGGAGGLGGYTFEETLQGGGDSDPFGIGGMNFDAGAIAGIPSGSRTKRRRRKK